MPQPDRPAWIEVNLSAIANNISTVRQFVSPTTQVMAIVKANAYGHGLIPASRAAIKGGASALGVALLQEGVVLRNAGITAPVVVLAPTMPEQADSIVAHNLSQTIGHPDAIPPLEAAAKRHNTRARIHLKVDTGMGRLGLLSDEVLAVAKKIDQNPHLFLEGIATHVAWERAEYMDKARHQIKTFAACLSKLTHISVTWRHAANSVMTVHMPESHFDLVRVGLLTYGIPPTQGAGPLSLSPALSIKAQITQVRNFSAGQTLSYGGTY
ncbi:MAG: alanine racemase, partial [Gemmatimonadetes bacterium]|nr:alanine racemase [Gemmatimonadota bacterium]